ncbi:MAG TPA: hypothetical protein VIK18_25025 [Pirellulales bacterium]
MFELHWRQWGVGMFVAWWGLVGAPVCHGQSVESGNRNLQIERTVDRALERPVDFSVRGMSLRDAVRALGQACGVNFMLDKRALEEAGIGEDEEIEAAVQGNSADAALVVMLRPLELTWVVRDGQAVVTTVSVAETVIDTRIYPVYDLVIAHDEQGAYADFDSLIEVVTSNIAPTTWSEVGGAGGIKPFFNSQSIVVSQTRDVHREIEMLLAGLRSARDVQGLNRRAASVPQSAPFDAPPAASPARAGSLPVTSQPASLSPGSRLVRVYE